MDTKSTAVVYCPACETHFGVPVLLECGHTLCSECVDASNWEGSKSFPCAVCCLQSSIHKTFTNQLFAIAEPKTIESSPADASLENLARQLEARAKEFDSLALHIERARDDLLIHAESSKIRFSTKIAEWIQKLKDLEIQIVARSADVCRRRLKILDAKADVASVTAGQLYAGAKKCRAAAKMTSIPKGELENAANTMLNAQPSLDLQMPHPAIVLNGHFKLQSALLFASAYVEDFVITLSAEGPGIASCVADNLGARSEPFAFSVHENTFTLTCTSTSRKCLAPWVKASDVSISVQSENTEEFMCTTANVQKASTGVFKVTYKVAGTTSHPVVVTVNVNKRCNDKDGLLTPSSWTIQDRVVFLSHSAMLRSSRVDSILRVVNVSVRGKLNGLAVSNDGVLMAASNSDANCIDILDATTGEHRHRFGTTGNGKDDWLHPRAIYTTSAQTLLVIDGGNNRVKEITWTGETVAVFRFPDYLPSTLFAVAEFADTLAVSAVSHDSQTFFIGLLSRSTGELVAAHYLPDVLLGRVSDLQFSHDGKYVFVLHPDGRVVNAVSMSTGKTVAVLYKNTCRFAGTFILCRDGSVIVNNKDGVVVCDKTGYTDTVVTSISGDSKAIAPSSDGKALFVLTSSHDHHNYVTVYA